MKSPILKRFLVFYLTPAAVMAQWAKTDAAVRAPREAEMQAAWQQWMVEHATLLRSTEAAGRTKCVTAQGIRDGQNDIMLYSIVEAESHESAAAAFADHPHLGIPESSIEVMEITPLGGS